MELSHLRYFVAVASAGSFARAAESVHVTQPALSKAIAGLEAGLGVRLLERTTRSVQMTHAGERVLERARVILADAAALARDANDAVHAIRGPLRIGAMEVLSLDVLPAALTALVTAHPDVVPSCFEQPPDRLLQGVARGELDVAFTVGGAASDALRRHVLGTSPAVVVCGQDHALAALGGGRASRADFLSHPWVVPRFFADPPGSRPIDQFPDERLARPIGATIELLRSGVELVAGGRFLGCFPAISIRRELADGRLVRLRGHPAVPPFELAAYERARSAGSPTVRAVIEAVQRAVRRSPESARP